jgi:hypothetical protein
MLKRSTLKYDEAFNQNDAEAVADLFTADAVESGRKRPFLVNKKSRCKLLFEPHPNSHATKISAKPRSAPALSEATGRTASNPLPGLIPAPEL